MMIKGMRGERFVGEGVTLIEKAAAQGNAKAKAAIDGIVNGSK